MSQPNDGDDPRSPAAKSDTGPNGPTPRQLVLYCVAGATLCALPCVVPLPLTVDKLVYGIGAVCVANSTMALVFPEFLAWSGRGAIPFRTRRRKYASLTLAIVEFIAICTVYLLARSQGWWR